MGASRLVILISGRGSNALALARAASDGRLGSEISAIIADRPAPGLEAAAELGLDTVMLPRDRYQTRPAFEAALADAIDPFRPDRVVLAGFMRVLSAGFVERYRGRMLNIHPSLLPRHRGLDTHRRVLEAGEREHGASVHFVTPELDAGPVLAQVRMDVVDGDTPESLAARLLALEHRLYPAAMALLDRSPVEFRHDIIYLDEQPLDRPFILGHDLDDDGTLLAR